ncbi:MAG TPA: AIR synthase-related protein, partial [Fimbriimonas sp.]|nr:AIR synthase-related protein [Fimbriimonas sp.]
AAKGQMSAAHDVSEGGIAVTLAELAITHKVGIGADLPENVHPFGEYPGMVVVATSDVAGVTATAAGFGIPATILGEASSDGNLNLKTRLGSISQAVNSLESAYKSAFDVVLM